MDEISKELKIWCENDEKLPYKSSLDSNFKISLFTMGLKIYLLKKVDKNIQLPMIWSSSETRFRKSRIRSMVHL